MGSTYMQTRGFDIWFFVMYNVKYGSLEETGDKIT